MKEKQMSSVKKLLLMCFIIVPLMAFVFFECSEKSTKSTESPSPMVRFTNQSDYLNMQITKFRHTRGDQSIFKNMDQYVKKGDSFVLTNLIDGGSKPFKKGDIVSVTFECYQVDPERLHSERAECVVGDIDINIIAIGECEYTID